MPRTAAQNKAIKDRRRSKLLSTALKVFADEGYDEVTIDHITKAAHCSHGLFYHYFPSKESVFEAIYNEIIVTSKIVPPMEALKTENTLQGLAVFAEYVEKISDASAEEISIVFIIGSAWANKNIRRANTDILTRFDYRPLLDKLIEKGQKEGFVFDGDPVEIRNVLASLILAIALRRKYYAEATETIRKDTVLKLVLKKPLEEIK